MEKKVIAKVNGTEYSVACHGNASYRVWMGTTPVNKVFASESEAAEYALRAAKADPSVLIGRATVEVVEDSEADETVEAADEAPATWYAVLRDEDDNDWGTGSRDLAEAEEKARWYRANGYPAAYIAVIADGADPICTAEIRDF